jgi:hypothetical protein
VLEESVDSTGKATIRHYWNQRVRKFISPGEEAKPRKQGEGQAAD